MNSQKSIHEVITYWIGNLMQYITLLYYHAIKCSALAWCMKWSYFRLSIFHIQCSIFKALLWLSMSHIPHTQGSLIHIPYIQGFLIHIQGSLIHIPYIQGSIYCPYSRLSWGSPSSPTLRSTLSYFSSSTQILQEHRRSPGISNYIPSNIFEQNLHSKKVVKKIIKIRQPIENILRNCCPMAICKTGNTISR